VISAEAAADSVKAEPVDKATADSNLRPSPVTAGQVISWQLTH
jgi:hypothetical protein